MSSDFLTKIDSSNFQDKSILIIGAGWIAKQYASALTQMKIKNVTVVSMKEEKAKQLCDEFGFIALSGGYEKNLPNLKKMDLVIIATPVHLLLPATELALKYGQTNILIEKPASLYADNLITFSNNLKSERIRVGYNRLLYPNLHLLKELIKKEGGFTSCNFTFTEWVHTINFKKDRPDAYKRWGIANTLHIISMVFDLIGMPKEISTYQSGSLDWHPTGSIFVGSGISNNNIPFAYQADWGSSGRWGIEVMTNENAYRLIPLEELYVCPKGSVNWKKISFNKAFSDVKQGMAEEIAVMLSENLPNDLDLPTLEKAAQLNKVAEKIFGYDPNEKNPNM